MSQSVLYIEQFLFGHKITTSGKFSLRRDSFAQGTNLYQPRYYYGSDYLRLFSLLLFFFCKKLKAPFHNKNEIEASWSFVKTNHLPIRFSRHSEAYLTQSSQVQSIFPVSMPLSSRQIVDPPARERKPSTRSFAVRILPPVMPSTICAPQREPQVDSKQPIPAPNVAPRRFI